MGIYTVVVDQNAYVLAFVAAALLVGSELSETHLLLVALRRGASVGDERFPIGPVQLGLYTVLPALVGAVILLATMHTAAHGTTQLTLLLVALVSLNVGHFVAQAELVSRPTKNTVIIQRVVAGVFLALFAGCMGGFVEVRAEDLCGPVRDIFRVASYMLIVSLLITQRLRFRLKWLYRFTAWLMASLVSVCWVVVALSTAISC